MIDSVASSSTASEKEFYVCDIPSSVTDWDLFRAFRRYGLVNSIRIPTNQTAEKKYGFVAMIGLDSAENVRKDLNKGRLMIDQKISVMINNTRNGAEKESKPLKQTGFGNRRSAPQQSSPANGVPFNRSRTFEKKKAVYVMPKLHTRDLPLHETIKVIMVPSPFPPVSEDGLVFHVYRLDYAIPAEFDDLQKKMNDYCEQSKCIALHGDAPVIKIGDPLIYGKDAIAYRGIRTGAKEIYLVDVNGGKRVEFNENQVWLMQTEFCSPPTLIASCSLANVEWCDGAADHFSRYRDVLINWSTKEGGLSITVRGYQKSHNVVDVFGSAGTLVDSLSRQGMVKKVATEGRHYEKEELLSLKDKSKDVPDCVNKNKDIASILVVGVTSLSL